MSLAYSRVLGVKVAHCSNRSAIAEIERLVHEKQRGAVAFCNVHMVMTAYRDAVFRSRINDFELVCPDGQPVRWAVNLLSGAGLRERVYGPSVMFELCRRAAEAGLGVFLYGSYPETNRRLAARLKADFASLRIVGRLPSRFRAATPEEDLQDVLSINESGADIVFVGLGCPLQENWIFEHRESIRGVLLGVGAAFDFHAGTVPQAPPWMQNAGLEWFYRLSVEPRRLWRRYVFNNPLYLVLLARQWAVAKGRRVSTRRSELQSK